MQYEIFCGTGGVGKTTLATSRAFYHHHHGKRVLLLTIDPSRRLKQLLNLDNDTHDIPTEIIPGLFAYCFSPFHSFRRQIHANENPYWIQIFQENPIFQNLLSPQGGMNEILSLLDLSQLPKLLKVDIAILDTAPGKHFLDFLNTSEKIHSFFEKSFLDVFHYFEADYIQQNINHAKNSNPSSLFLIRSIKNFSILGTLAKSSIQKILKLLEQVTGKEFCQRFISAMQLLLSVKSEFLKAAQLEKTLKEPHSTHWFFVTSSQNDKVKETQQLFIEANKILNDNQMTILINFWRFTQKSESLLNKNNSEIDQYNYEHEQALQTNLLEKFISNQLPKIYFPLYNHIEENQGNSEADSHEQAILKLQIQNLTKAWDCNARKFNVTST